MRITLSKMRTKKILKTSLRRTRTRTTALRRRRSAQASACCKRRSGNRRSSSSAAASASVINGKGNGGKVSDKLEALKNLIPDSCCHVKGDGDHTSIKAEQLFQDTADYIILLRTRVVILQRLIQFYGSSANSCCSIEQDQNDNVNVLL